MGAHPSFSATQTQTNSAAGGGTLTPSVSQFHFSIDKQSYGFVSPPVRILPHQKIFQAPTTHPNPQKVTPLFSFLLKFLLLLLHKLRIRISAQLFAGQFWTIFRPIGGKVVFVVSSCRRFLGELNLGASCSRQYFIELDFGHPVTLAWLQLKSVSCWVK